MTLKEFYEAARAKFPKHDIDVAEHLTTRDKGTWFWAQFVEKGTYSGPSAIGNTPEEVLAQLKLPDRVAAARKALKEANKILAEEGALDDLPEATVSLDANSGGE